MCAVPVGTVLAAAPMWGCPGGAAVGGGCPELLCGQGTQPGISQAGCFLPMGAAWHPVARMTPTSQFSLEKQRGAVFHPVQLSHSCCQAPHCPPPILHQELSICIPGPAKTLGLTCPCRGKDRCAQAVSTAPKVTYVTLGSPDSYDLGTSHPGDSGSPAPSGWRPREEEEKRMEK